MYLQLHSHTTYFDTRSCAYLDSLGKFGFRASKINVGLEPGLGFKMRTIYNTGPHYCEDSNVLSDSVFLPYFLILNYQNRFAQLFQYFYFFRARLRTTKIFKIPPNFWAILSRFSKFSVSFQTFHKGWTKLSNSFPCFSRISTDFDKFFTFLSCGRAIAFPVPQPQTAM